MNLSGNILYFAASSGHNAMNDLFKNLVNNAPQHDNIVAIVPNGYAEAEFASTLLHVEYDPITGSGDKSKRRGILRQLFRYIRYAFYLTKVIRHYKIKKIFFIHNHYIYHVPIILLNRDCEYTMWLHDPLPHEGESRKEAAIRRLGEKFVYPHIKRFIISYQGAIQVMQKRCALSPYVSRATVIPLPQMKTMEFPDVKEDVSLKVKWTFVFYGRIEEYKGLDLLLEAMQDASMDKIRLLIIGRGREDAKIQAMTDQLSNVTFINTYVPDKDLARYICQSRFVILPYRSATGSQTIAIANYYNKLVLATKVGCFTEYIKEGKNGFFINHISSNAIREAMLAINDINEEEYTASIRKEYDKFDLKKIATQVYAIVQS